MASPAGAGYRVAIQRADLADEGVAAHLAPVIDRHDVGSPQHGGQRIAAAHDLSDGAEVGSHPVEFLRASIGQTEAGHHFVKISGML